MKMAAGLFIGVDIIVGTAIIIEGQNCKPTRAAIAKDYSNSTLLAGLLIS
jgi:hypothetical protein